MKKPRRLGRAAGAKSARVLLPTANQERYRQTSKGMLALVSASIKSGSRYDDLKIKSSDYGPQLRLRSQLRSSEGAFPFLARSFSLSRKSGFRDLKSPVNWAIKTFGVASSV